MARSYCAEARARGLLDEHEHPDTENVEINEKINRLMNDRFKNTD